MPGSAAWARVDLVTSPSACHALVYFPALMSTIWLLVAHARYGICCEVCAKVIHRLSQWWQMINRRHREVKETGLYVPSVKGRDRPRQSRNLGVCRRYLEGKSSSVSYVA
ncbi:hypothetical protein SAMN05421874_102568 [Nonomuraea maritima]|uniref:Uncharacterized protein n=1 Tax=Nonomuraea maritima TaxID=683260 RepID=A0A1G8VGK6_9ACTN|nr:hypothetical protein SAMN05421874_102568 [Nonomuraea maritima]